MTRAGVAALIGACCFAVGPRRAAADNIEHKIVVGVGGAAELELRERSFHPGANVMVELDAIENWLEVELGASLLSAEGGVEVPVDLLLKKPFALGRRAELFVGVGPEVVFVANPTTTSAYAGVELALDLFYWPWRRVGLWIEPSYDLVFRDRPSLGIGTTAGFVFGW